MEQEEIFTKTEEQFQANHKLMWNYALRGN